MTITVYEIEQITPGARHVWLKTNVGRIRKPIGEVKAENFDFSKTEKNKIVLVEKRLLEWGRWVLKATTAGLGYPSQSTLVTALQGSPATVSPAIPLQPEIEEVEACVRKLEQENQQWSKVLRKHYTRSDDEQPKACAKSLELSERTYFYYLTMARKKVEFFLKRA